MKRSLCFLVLIFMAGCSVDSQITQQDLMHHHWVLTSMDNDPVATNTSDAQLPDLEIGENLTVNGTTGCNRYRGQGILTDNHFRVHPLSTTRRGCSPAFSKTEQTLTSVLTDGAEIIKTDNQLILKNAKHKLVYRLKDWM